ncbi:hypothetical protein GDO86_014131 [Hymenochirus boettgeri]|uniref:Uncharacterized protein n=1 Tax=Hymenochirus boettgeri TaxID=247094 RepID=A0A8T2JTA6_9PIPI|nr:hypothetical protein GDO86_014131 [Hymenochirus boettgeri]
MQDSASQKESRNVANLPLPSSVTADSNYPRSVHNSTSSGLLHNHRESFQYAVESPGNSTEDSSKFIIPENTEKKNCPEKSPRLIQKSPQ